MLERPSGARRPISGKERFLVLRDVPMPRPGPREVLMQVMACGVCRTELDQVEGRIAPQKLPVIVGHQRLPVRPDLSPRFLRGSRVLAKLGARQTPNSIVKHTGNHSRPMGFCSRVQFRAEGFLTHGESS